MDLRIYQDEGAVPVSSGEGGFLATNDEELISKAIIHSGSYGHYIQVKFSF